LDLIRGHSPSLYEAAMGPHSPSNSRGDLGQPVVATGGRTARPDPAPGGDETDRIEELGSPGSVSHPPEMGNDRASLEYELHNAICILGGLAQELLRDTECVIQYLAGYDEPGPETLACVASAARKLSDRSINLSLQLHQRGVRGVYLPQAYRLDEILTASATQTSTSGIPGESAIHSVVSVAEDVWSAIRVGVSSRPRPQDPPDSFSIGIDGYRLIHQRFARMTVPTHAQFVELAAAVRQATARARKEIRELGQKGALHTVAHTPPPAQPDLRPSDAADPSTTVAAPSRKTQVLPPDRFQHGPKELGALSGLEYRLLDSLCRDGELLASVSMREVIASVYQLDNPDKTSVAEKKRGLDQLRRRLQKKLDAEGLGLLFDLTNGFLRLLLV